MDFAASAYRPSSKQTAERLERGAGSSGARCAASLHAFFPLSQEDDGSARVIGGLYTRSKGIEWRRRNEGKTK